MKWLVGIVVLLGLAWLGKLSFLFFSFYLLGFLFFSNWYWTRFSLNQIVVQTNWASCETEIGTKIIRRIKVINAGRFLIPWILLEDLTDEQPLIQNPPRLKLSARRLHLIRLKAGHSTELVQEIECLIRGYYRFGPVLLESGDVFGFKRAFKFASAPCFLTVFPRPEPLRDYDFTSKKRLGEVRMTHRLFEDPSRICGIREYEPGDPINRIDWKASARVGTLHSKKFDPTTISGATLLLDFQQESFPSGARGMTSELAVSAAITLAEYLCLRSKKVGLVSNGIDPAARVYPKSISAELQTREEAIQNLTSKTQDCNQAIHIPTLNSPMQFARFREALARIEMAKGKSFYDMTLGHSAVIPRDASVLAILCALTVHEHAPALSLLKRRGFSVSVILIQSPEQQYFDWSEGNESIRLLYQERVPFKIISSAAELQDLCSRDQLGLHL